MGMVVRTNTMALNAYRQLGMNNSAVSKSLEKLSSGFRINRAGDDAAGLAISEKMKAQIKGLETASANAQDGISLIQTAEGNLNEVHDMLNRMVELATKSANGTYTETEREALQDEVDQLLEEVDRISQSANFNGTKLLDGSLSAKGGNSKIKIENVRAQKSAATKASFTQQSAFIANDFPGGTAAAVAGDTLTYTVALEDGTSYTAKLTWANNENGELKSLVNEDGVEVATTATAGTVAAGEIAGVLEAFKKELEKTPLGEMFTISQDGNNLAMKFESKSSGSGDVIKALGFDATSSGISLSKNAATEIDVKATLPLTDGYEINADDIIEYNGKNYEDAVFTINGHKFVLLTDDHEGTNTNPKPEVDVDMNATYGLGEDVTILIGGRDGLKKGADDNFNQNIAMIADVTGLTVTDAVDEQADYGAQAKTGVDPGNGIRLSAGKANGGLVLQIGDTAEEFNKMRVSIDDMSAKGLKINSLDITTEASASNAIDKVKKAINTVSSTRATMGALQNRLEHTINNLDVAVENLSSANSRIRDTDMAKEMMNYTKMNVLVQSAQAMLAQANQQPQSVLQLLQ